VWPVLQLHDNRSLPELAEVAEKFQPITAENFRPSPSEVMAQIHACVAADANAIVTYHLPARNFSMKSIPSHWEELSKIFNQTRELEPVWLSQEPRPEFTVVDSANK